MDQIAVSEPTTQVMSFNVHIGLTKGTIYYAVAKAQIQSMRVPRTVYSAAADRTFTKHSIPGSSFGSMLMMSMQNGNPDSLEMVAQSPLR